MKYKILGVLVILLPLSIFIGFMIADIGWLLTLGIWLAILSPFACGWLASYFFEKGSLTN